MNKLNGGYIMIDGSSSTLQADLQKAYESTRPVLFYKDGAVYYANIKKANNKYFAYTSNYKKSISITGTDENSNEFQIPVYTDILNWQDITYADISYLSFTLFPTDENQYGENTYEVLSGELVGYDATMVHKGQNSAVEYDLYSIENATSVTIEDF